MATTFRQDLSRFDEIEVGDSVTYHTPTISREEREWVQFPNATEPPYGKYVTNTVVKERAGGYYPTGKIVGGSAATGWELRESGASKKAPLAIVTIENFWALRKAPGKGKTEHDRFEADDAIVSCQVCAGEWIGNTGVLPHHGYTRPGWGEQTASCPGALHVPYSVIQGRRQAKADTKGRVPTVGRHLLPAIIESYVKAIASTEAHIAMLAAGGPDQFDGLDAHKPMGAYDKPDSPRRKPIAKGTKGFDYTNDYEKRLRYEQNRAEDTLRELQSALEYYRERFALWQPGGDALLAPAADASRTNLAWDVRVAINKVETIVRAHGPTRIDTHAQLLSQLKQQHADATITLLGSTLVA